MDQIKQAIMQIANLVENITLVAKDGGRESGLTGGDRKVYSECIQIIAKALDEGAAAQKALNETKDELAQIRAELDQVKAQSDASKTPKQKQDDFSQKCMAMQGVG